MKERLHTPRFPPPLFACLSKVLFPMGLLRNYSVHLLFFYIVFEIQDTSYAGFKGLCQLCQFGGGP